MDGMRQEPENVDLKAGNRVQKIGGIREKME